MSQALTTVSLTTRCTYSSGERQFIRFCLHHGLVSPHTPLLPSSEATLIHFVTHLSNTVSYATIKVYLAAVKNLHLSLVVNWTLPPCPSFIKLYEA